MSDPIPTPGVRVGQVWRAKQPKQRLPYLHITAVDHRHAEGRVTEAADEPGGGRNTRLERRAVPQRYVLVSEGGAPDA